MSSMQSSPHAHQRSSTGQLMLQVILACVPGAAALWSFFGWGVLFNLLWLTLAAVVLEACVLTLRKRPLGLFLCDYSAVVTAVLLALALPPTAPWWLGLIGISVAIVVAKQLYGGLGYNPFNPAMAGYALLLVAFPVQMTSWLLPAGISNELPDFVTAFTIFLDREVPQGIDAYVGATALDAFRQQGVQAVVIEAVKLLESGQGQNCDEIWCVVAWQNLQIERMMVRRSLSRNEATARLASQPSPE
ncbi:MAG: dephospho-CoA kinase, partial [Pseudomonadota bacterium]